MRVLTQSDDFEETKRQRNEFIQSANKELKKVTELNLSRSMIEGVNKHFVDMTPRNQSEHLFCKLKIMNYGNSLVCCVCELRKLELTQWI